MDKLTPEAFWKRHLEVVLGDEDKHPRKGLDFILEYFDDHFWDGNFENIDLILRDTDVSLHNTTTNLALLGFSNAAKEHLPSRKGLYDRVAERLRITDPDRVDRLLKGLE
jgi:hypothetical protein